MGNKCTICNGHEQRRAIDKAILKGVSFRLIASQYGTSDATIRRHKKHIISKIQKAQEKQDTQVVKIAKNTIEIGVIDVDLLIATVQNAQMANLAIIQRASKENAANIQAATINKVDVDRQILYANEKMIAVSTVPLLKCIEALKSFMPEPPKNINLNVEAGILGMDLKSMSTEELLAIRDA